MPFVGELDLRDIGAQEFQLLDGLDYLTVSGRELIRVPKGFRTDLASIPKGLRWLISVNGKHKKAAVIHDYLYSKQGVIEYFKFTRKESDQVFHDAMLELGVSWWKRRTMYLGVRVGGWVFWNA